MTVLFGIVLTWAVLHLEFRIFMTNRAPKGPGSHRSEATFVSP